METVKSDWNVIVEADREKILKVALDNSSHSISCLSQNIFGNGKTVERIVKVLVGSPLI